MDMRASMPSRAIKVNRMTPHYFQRHDETKKWVNEARNQTMILQDMEPDRDDFNAKSSSCNELRILGKDLPKTFRIEKSISRPCDRKLRTRGFSEGPTTGKIQTRYCRIGSISCGSVGCRSKFGKEL